jgi:hypothetical protein
MNKKDRQRAEFDNYQPPNNDFKKWPIPKFTTLRFHDPDDAKRISDLERQLAEKDELIVTLRAALERCVILLRAAQSFVYDNCLEENTVIYDDAECDGYCLIEDCEAAITKSQAALAKVEKK